MKKFALVIVSIISITLFIKCGKAGEDRVLMHKKAKRVSDSIAAVIDSALVIKP